MNPMIIVVGVVIFILGCLGVYSYVQEFKQEFKQKRAEKRGKKESGKDAKTEYIRKVKKVQ